MDFDRRKYQGSEITVDGITYQWLKGAKVYRRKIGEPTEEEIKAHEKREQESKLNEKRSFDYKIVLHNGNEHYVDGIDVADAVEVYCSPFVDREKCKKQIKKVEKVDWSNEPID